MIANFVCTLPYKVVIFSAHKKKLYKICKLHKAIFCAFYNVLQPSSAIVFTNFKMLFPVLVLLRSKHSP